MKTVQVVNFTGIELTESHIQAIQEYTGHEVRVTPIDISDVLITQELSDWIDELFGKIKANEKNSDVALIILWPVQINPLVVALLIEQLIAGDIYPNYAIMRWSDQNTFQFEGFIYSEPYD